jgi:hypothetical protein
MTRMPRVDWQLVRDDDFSVPPDQPLPDLTAELTELLGSPDPHVRDELALEVLCNWVSRGVYDDLLTGLGDGMAAGLGVGLGERETDSVFRRSFSALILGECIARDNQRPLVPGGKILEWGDRVATWLLRERDLRGFVPGKGWAHAAAHGADVLAALAGSEAMGRLELTVLLDVIADRLVTDTGDRLVHGEDDRLAYATMGILHRDLVALEVLEPWLARLADAARTSESSDRDVDPYRTAGNVRAYLRALHLQLAVGPRPPATRADLLLTLIDHLKRIHPDFLT